MKTKQKTLSKRDSNTWYGIWIEEEGCKFWEVYSTIYDALSARGDNLEVFEFNPKHLGKFKVFIGVEKVKTKTLRRTT